MPVVSIAWFFLLAVNTTINENFEKIWLLIVMLQEGWFAGKISSGIESSASRIITKVAVPSCSCQKPKGVAGLLQFYPPSHNFSDLTILSRCFPPFATTIFMPLPVHN